MALSPPDVADYAAAQTSFAALAPWSRFRHALVANGVSEVIAGEMVGGDYFRVVGLDAAIGRALQPADDRPGAPRVIVLEDGLWRRRFGGDPAVIGRTVNGDRAATGGRRQRVEGWRSRHRIARGLALLLRMVLLDGVRPVAEGLALGLGIGVLLRLTFRPLFVNVLPAFDPLILLLVPAAFLTSALVAAYVPARRAASVDPAIALRAE